MVLRYEAGQCQRHVHFRQLVDARRKLLGFIQRGHQDVRRIGRSRGILHQVEQRRDGFDLRTAQIQRIEIEAQLGGKTDADQSDESRGDQNAQAMTDQEMVDRRQRPPAHLARLARRTQHGDQRR